MLDSIPADSKFYQIAFSEDVVRKFRPEEGGFQAMVCGPGGEVAGRRFEPSTQDTSKVLKRPNSRQLFINLKKSLIMEDIEEINSPPSPKQIGYRKKDIKKNPPVTRYEQIIYNRGSSIIDLPERMVLPNGVEDIMLYPTAVKRNSGTFFADEQQQDNGGTGRLKHMDQDTKALWSKESDPDVVIDREGADS